MTVFNPTALSEAPFILVDPASINLSDGVSVASYSDLSGNNNNLYCSGPTYPTFKKNISQNSNLPAIRFNNSNVLASNLFNWPSVGQVTVILFVSGVYTTPNYGGILSASDSIGTDYSSEFGFAFSLNGSQGFDVSSGGGVLGLLTASNTNYAGVQPVYFQGSGSLFNASVMGFGQRFTSGTWTSTQGASFDLLGCAIYASALSMAQISLDYNYMLEILILRQHLLSESIVSGLGFSGGFSN